MPYDQWNHELSKTYGAWVPAKTPSSNFRAQLAHQTLGNFELVECICDPCSATRYGRQISSDDLEMLGIQLILSGKEQFVIEDQSYSLEPGDLLVWDTTRPMKFQITERLQKVSVLLPLSRLRSWMPGSWHRINHKHARGTPTSTLIYALVKSIVPELFAGKLRNGDALTEGMLATLVGTLDGDIPTSSSMKSLHLERIKRFIDQHLRDRELTPASIAKANHMSVRYLHGLFESQDLTVQQYVLSQRLYNCHRELTAQCMSQRSVTDIAFSWGFRHPSHFSRRFKQQFGQSPKSCREQSDADKKAAQRK